MRLALKKTAMEIEHVLNTAAEYEATDYETAVKAFAEKARKQTAKAHETASGIFEVRLWYRLPHPPGVLNYEVAGIGPDEAAAWISALWTLADWYGCSEEELLIGGEIG